MLNFEPDDTEIYRTMLDRIVIHKDRILVVYLKTLPFGIHLRYHSKGKQETFNVRFAYLGKETQSWKELQSSRRAVR